MNEHDIALHRAIFDVLTRFYQEHSEITEKGRKGMPITSFSIDGLGLMLFDVIIKEVKTRYTVREVIEKEVVNE